MNLRKRFRQLTFFCQYKIACTLAHIVCSNENLELLERQEELSDGSEGAVAAVTVVRT